MNYTLTINLEGAEKADAALDNVSKKLSLFKTAGSPIGTLKIGVNDINKAFERAAKESEKFEKNLNKVLNLSNKIFKPALGSFGTGQEPKVTIASGAIPGYQGISGNPLQAQAGGIGGGGLASGGEALPKTAGEIKAERELRIKKEAIEARRKDLMEADAKRAMTDRASFYKNMTFLMMPLFNPGSVWATLFSTHQTFSAMNTNTGQGAIGKFGLSGLSGSATATAALVAAATAIGMALKALKMVVEGVTAAFEKARLLYAKALTSGIGLESTARRSLLASIIGVSEKDIYQFGSAVQFLNPRIQNAARIFAETATPLTEVSYRFRILKEDISALFAKIAVDLAPAVGHLIDVVDRAVISLTNLYNSGFFKKLIGNTFFAGTPLGPIWDKLGFATGKTGNAGTNSTANALGAPQSYMKQIPASAWEKMGLIIGGGQQQTTNELIKKSNQYLAAIAQAVAGAVTGQPMGAFGLSAVVANP